MRRDSNRLASNSNGIASGELSLPADDAEDADLEKGTPEILSMSCHILHEAVPAERVIILRPRRETDR